MKLEPGFIDAGPLEHTEDAHAFCVEADAAE
jgi:hypothetical protein